ncbi:hypothetical protein DPMN_151950 [Dreissena polymorpha]|uniref:palmitoyl-CoA hydrolase n=1 Tax=Dreissena polymorpha TaxID=45954 RepID=A0A9D4J3G0_DREPO|nr:hypothetical protein DPMN_151950 [Dreissena polymorpha]
MSFHSMAPRLTFVLLSACMIYTGNGYKPVVYMHGIFGSYKESAGFLKWIEEEHSSTETLSIDAYNNADSAVNLMQQIQDIAQILQAYMNSHPGGINLICYSQGGLICRGVLEHIQHNVDTFISLSSPQAGQFGDTQYLKYLFPHLLRDQVYRIAYSEEGQNISVSNYWNDPHHQDLYLKYSKYLAVLNNETFSPDSQKFKNNFTLLKRLVMLGGPDDGVITPWQSSHFGFYDKDLNIVEMKNQPWYTNDWFGLRTLDSRGGLVTKVIPGVQHNYWIRNHTVFMDHILPYLN